MNVSPTARVTSVWFAMSVITIGSWALAAAHDGRHLVSSTPITVAVLVFGLVKTRFIMGQFMAVRRAPTWLCRLTDVWLAVFWVAVLAIYLA